MHTISEKPDYLLVTIEGKATYQDFQNALKEELARNDYRDMNDIWQLDNCILLVSHDQFKNIVNEINNRYPKSASRTKTALVASSGVSRALMQFWAESAKTLSYEIQVFMALNEAKAWINESGQ